MNGIHKPITIWQLIASRLAMHIAVAVLCIVASNMLLNQFWMPVYFQMDHNLPQPRQLLLEPDLEHYQDISPEQLSLLSASLQVLDENLVVVESVNAAIEPGYQYSAQELTNLLLADQENQLLHTKQITAQDGTVLTVILKQQLDQDLFALLQQNARVYATITHAISGLVLIVCILSFIRSIYKPLQKNLTIINDSIARTPHNPTPVDPAQVSLLETQTVLRTYNTMLQEIEQAKAEKERLKEQSQRLIANLSHDLKSPMTSLRGYTELLEQQWLSPEEQQLYLSRIHSNISALNSMVELLSEQVQYQYNDYPLQLERKDMNQFLREICANYYTIFEKQGFTMEIDIPERPYYLEFDLLNMRRVYANLLENILSHNPTPAAVQICTASTAQGYRVQIKDNGVGIAAEQKDKIFDPFYQGDLSRTKQHSGLGLFVVQQILEKHGASILLEQEPAYKTVFTIHFPPALGR